MVGGVCVGTAGQLHIQNLTFGGRVVVPQVFIVEIFLVKRPSFHAASPAKVKYQYRNYYIIILSLLQALSSIFG